MTVVLIDDAGSIHELDGEAWLVDASALQAASGWQLEAEGLCRGTACIPLRDRDITAYGGKIDLLGWAEALGYATAQDDGHAALAVASPPDVARAASVGDSAPDLELPDVDGGMHRLSDAAGRKRVLVTWASWCGCRHELASWQALHTELEPLGLSIFSVALDNSAEDARPWIEAASPTYPVVVDSAHVTAERYGITNVPSTVWVDEEGRVVKPPTISPGDDQFRDFTQIDASAHHDALRAWVRDGALPVAGAAHERTAEEQTALAERRLGAWLHAAGDVDAARAHFERAVALAPWDWTVRRGSLAIRGEDPFLGEEFVAFWQEWDSAGRPGYGAMDGAK
ncbi:MAG TPA: TlpA disulfide reductase family protein [Mycobacteriales bacterium]|jgi:peroxiredoxin|nr:TlpA disulfide reductase family protein [Mycobacteriales bacterium]